jgi:hypothetical protein
MFKIILLILGVALSHSWTQLTLVDCQVQIGGYKGLYKSFSGNYYVFTFDSYCPYSYTIK